MIQIDPMTVRAHVATLREEVASEGRALYDSWGPDIRRRAFRLSALNLAHYLALRRRDLRDLQTALSIWGLSSLGRSEGRVLPNLDAVLYALTALADLPRTGLRRPTVAAFFRGQRLLEHNSRALLGEVPPTRRVRIMVTMPSEAATDYKLVRAMLERGMNTARINTAHDSTDAWAAMVQHVRRAEAELNTRCTILLDLGGPKVRTEAVVTEDRVRRGQQVLITRDAPVPNPRFVHQASCSLPEVIGQVGLGQAVWIDDGALGGRVSAIVPEGLVVDIVYAPSEGKKLKPDKGLNFPETELRLSPLTDKDRADLDFAVPHVDTLGYSFVQEASDIALLQRELAARAPDRWHKIGIVAKVETPRAVRNLPEMIVQAAGAQPFGVMIARGDLAVEIGWERLAEIQEELLWLCEAAHVPVIWATQVLENFVKEGLPSRAEMTDAAMSERAECVMLNKGPYILEAISMLGDVLQRMAGHQFKKTPRLRELRMWQQQ